MRVLGRLSIRARLYFGTAFSLALLVLVGGMGYVSLDRTRTTLQVLFAERVQTLTDMSDLRTTLGEHFGTINASNLRRAHALLESGKAKGKIVLEGFRQDA